MAILGEVWNDVYCLLGARLILVRTILGSGDPQLFVTRSERGTISIRSRNGDGSKIF